jgi:hypothetical protein
MPPKKKSVKKESVNKNCICGSDCHDQDSHLPGLLLVALGLLALPINFGMIPGMQSALAWPLLIVLVGAVLVVKVGICRSASS